MSRRFWYARETLFGTRQPSVTGRGARLLLLDDGIRSPLDMGGRLRNLTPSTSLPETHHAARGASLCAEGAEAANAEGGPLGLAPQCEVLSASREAPTQEGYTRFLRQVLRDHGRPDVISHAYSAPETHALAHEGRAEFTLLADADPELASLHVAAAGHDGEKGVRFPASCESVLAVGVCDEEGRPTPYCSVSPEARKPELLVPDQPYAARREDGSLGALNGTSAAVNLVTGLAALWCERLGGLGVKLTPAVLRAALLASSRPSASPAHRVAVAHEALFASVPLSAAAEERQGEARWTYRLRVPARGTVQLCAVARRGPQSRLWLAPPLRVRLKAEGAAQQEITADNWARLDLEPATAGRLELTVEVEGPVEGLGLVVLGAEAEPAAQVQEMRRSTGYRRPRVVVGISASHDASASVIRDGKLVSSIQLERLSRRKHDGAGFLHSREAIDYCLQAVGLRPADVDLFAFNLQPVIPGYVGLSQPSADEAFDLFSPYGDRALFVSHHLAHAFGAFFGSPFEQATVFVADGSGGSTVGAPDLLLRGPQFAEYLAQPLTERPALHVQSGYTFSREGYQLVEREFAPSFNTRCGSSSLGEMYAAVSQYVFGDWMEGSGKLMGLAPYGDANACGPSFLTRDAHGRLQFRADWKERFRRATGAREPSAWRDLAARIQRDLEEALVDRLRQLVARTGLRDVAYTGGIALNSVANERLLRETGSERLYVLPASNDAGIAIGAAAAGEFVLNGHTSRAPVTSDFLGYAYREEDCRRALGVYSAVTEWEEADLGDIVDRLVAGQVIGWFEGGSEFGPRALGHRSILADPRQQQMWLYINRHIKFREDFRPFAPMVPTERAAEFFDITQPSPHMLRVVPVRPEFREQLGAVTHVDGSARVQTVDQDVHPRIHELLCRFGERTRLPILLNTSLNVRGEPIVETPLQAIELLLATHLDALVLGRYLVRPKRLRTGELRGDTRVRLPPKTRVVCEATNGKPSARLVAEARGRREYPLEPWAFRLLSHADGTRSINELLDTHLQGEVEAEAARELLSNLITARLLLVDEPAESPARTGHASAPTEAMASWKGLPLVLQEADHQPLPEGRLRTKTVEQTLDAVWPLRARLGITRVSDVTSYDHVGIPVIVATRPGVSRAQITATQGKGLRREEALASALLEAVERFSASQFRAQRIATPEELLAGEEDCCPPERLGASAVPGKRLEWVQAVGLRSGRRTWLPAAEVIFPYTAPEGCLRPMRPSTTGLAAGNTLGEAVAQALCEVVERDAVSQYLAGAAAPLLDLDSVSGPLERQILDRLNAAGLQFFVVDLSGLAALPVYMAYCWQWEGASPPVIPSGQGAALSPGLALRRALLEVVQCRLVTIQGSREDLIRHAPQWSSTHEAAERAFQEMRARSAEQGHTRLPPEPEPPGSVYTQLSHLLTRLEARGHDEVFVTELTHPDIGVPSVHVAVPGLVDTLVDPGRRRRVG